MNLSIMMKEGCDDLFPKKAHVHDACYDIYSREHVIIPAGGHACVKTGVYMSIPSGYEVVFRGRSGLAAKMGILAHVGTIDAGYKDECAVILYNTAKSDYEVTYGDRIGQFRLQKLENTTLIPVKSFTDDVDRGGGFGSSGR